MKQNLDGQSEVKRFIDFARTVISVPKIIEPIFETELALVS